MSARHSIGERRRIHFAPADTLEDKKARRDWYTREHPASLKHARNKQLVAKLEREIARMEQAA